eukprot:4045072-Pleurochrysis_carterae.AAC.1
MPYPINIAIKPDYSVSCPRARLLTVISFLLSSRLPCSKPSQRAAPFGTPAQFPIVYSRRMRTCGALVLRSPSFEIP